jgi:hypothetical protein
MPKQHILQKLIYPVSSASIWCIWNIFQLEENVRRKMCDSFCELTDFKKTTINQKMGP